MKVIYNKYKGFNVAIFFLDLQLAFSNGYSYILRPTKPLRDIYDTILLRKYVSVEMSNALGDHCSKKKAS